MIHAFYSDPHYGHANVIQYSNRPFADVEQMDNQLVYAYNQLIRPTDTVLWLGDCFLSTVDHAKQIMQRLNGTKVLVLGNHDRSAAAMTRIGFALVTTEVTMNIADQKVRAFHRPYPGTPSHEDHGYPALPTAKPEAPVRQKHEFLLHGHTHSTNKVRDRMIHVGVDAWDYKPVMYEQVYDLIKGLV
jgi:calcineurin-like phosphoesterase family protein